MKKEFPDWLMKDADEQFLNDPSSYLGSIIFAFQELEHVLVELFGELIDNIDYAKIIATEISFQRLLNIIESIMFQNRIEDSIITKYQEIKKEVENVERERNTYIHSYYEITEWAGDHIKYLRMKTRNKSGFKVMTETIADNTVFSELSVKIHELIVKVLDIEINFK